MKHPQSYQVNPLSGGFHSYSQLVQIQHPDSMVLRNPSFFYALV